MNDSESKQSGFLLSKFVVTLGYTLLMKLIIRTMLNSKGLLQTQMVI